MGVPTTIQIYLSVAIPIGLKAAVELVVYYCFRSSWPQFFCAARPDHELGPRAREWTCRLLALDDAQVLSTTGVDGLAYVLFQKFALKACSVTAIGLAVLGPIFHVGDARQRARLRPLVVRERGRTAEEGRRASGRCGRWSWSRTASRASRSRCCTRPTSACARPP